MDVTALIEQ